MEFVVISGCSGSGKSTALHQLEDEGYYCIDNIPIGLISDLVREARDGCFRNYRGVAVCIDLRTVKEKRTPFKDLVDQLALAEKTRVLFLDARDEKLAQRFSETRRPHPLINKNLSLIETIKIERELLEPIVMSASMLIDTSQMSVHDLRNNIKERFLNLPAGETSLLFQSFGFKRGSPSDADMVFDARILPNPYWIPKLRDNSGKHPEIVEFLGSHEITHKFFNQITSFLDNWLPLYRNGSRSYLTVAVGCTGGKHRSVYLIDRLFSHYESEIKNLSIVHRDLKKYAGE